MFPRGLPSDGLHSGRVCGQPGERSRASWGFVWLQSGQYILRRLALASAKSINPYHSVVEVMPNEMRIHTIGVLRSVSGSRILAAFAAGTSTEPRFSKMTIRYSEKQRLRDAEYDQLYRQWIASLGAAERLALAREGLDLPEIAAPKAGPTDPNIALLMYGTVDCIQEETAAANAGVGCSSGHLSEIAAAIASFCARIRGHASPLLAFDAACYAAGLMEVEGLNETDLARRHRVTRACFCKAVIHFSDTYGLRPSMGMRSKRARQNHRVARLSYLERRKESANGYNSL